MNILYVVHQNVLKENTGTPVVVNHYAKSALKNDCKVCVLTADDNLENTNKIKIINGIYYTSVKVFHNWSIDAFIKNKTNENININLPFVPDIIHILDWVNFDPEVIKYLSSLKKPIIRHFCNFEELCYFHHPFYNKKDHSLCYEEITPHMCSNCIAEKYFNDKKIISKLIMLLLNKKEKNKKNYYNKLIDRKKIVYEYINSYYSHLIFPSKSFSKFFFSHFKLQKPYSIVHHGINLDNEVNLKHNNNHKINFIFSGGVAIRKGWKIIEETFNYLLNKYPNKINLRIYGNKKKVSKSSLNKFQNVEFFEFFNHEDLQKILEWPDIGLLPSHFETYGLMIREYIHNKIVPISSNAFGADEVINHNFNGFILKKNTSKDLIDCIESIINNPNKLNELKRNLLKTSIISSDSEFKEIFSVYQKYVI